jgi:hypothetical protein
VTLIGTSANGLQAAVWAMASAWTIVPCKVVILMRFFFSFTLCKDHLALGALIFSLKNRSDVELALSRKKTKSESKYDKRTRHGKEHFLVTHRCSPGNSKIALV